MTSYSPIGIFSELSNYIIGKEKKDRFNTKLKDAVVENNTGLYHELIMDGYNPYRKDKDGKMSFEYSDNLKFFKLAQGWLYVLAFEDRPELSFIDISDSEPETQLSIKSPKRKIFITTESDSDKDAEDLLEELISQYKKEEECKKKMFTEKRRMKRKKNLH